MSDEAPANHEIQGDDEVSEESGRHSRRILVEFDADTVDAQNLAMAIWHVVQASRASEAWVLPTFEMRPEDNWDGSDDVEIVVRKKRQHRSARST